MALDYGFTTAVRGTLDEVRPRVEAALREQGFGILTEIDVQATLKKKLDRDFRPYVILGACNPALASRALDAAAHVGLLLPCNVVLQEQDGGVEVAFVDPAAMLGVVTDAGLAPVAAEAETRLRAACEALGGS